MHLPLVRSTSGGLRGELSTSIDTIVIYLFLAATVLLNVFPFGSLVRAVFGLPVLLFLTGYGVLLFLFPRRRRADDAGSVGLRDVERLALSFGVSLTLAPLIALGYELLGVPLTTTSVVVGFAAITGVCLLAGEGRRRRVATPERYTFPTGRMLEMVRPSRGTRYGMDDLLNLVLVLSMAFAVSSLGYGLVAPPTGEQYTNFYVATEGGDGGLVTAGYPSNLTEAGVDDIVLGVDNHEGRAVNYHIVVQLQRVSHVDTGDSSVLDREEVARTSLSVPENETGRTTLEFTPPVLDGEGRFRLVYLLYEGDVSGEPTMDTAYRSLYLWVESGDMDGSPDQSPTSRQRPGLGSRGWGEQ